MQGVTVPLSRIAIHAALAAVVTTGLVLPLVCAAQDKSRGDGAADRRARAQERCRANRGVDCDSAEGLNEWKLLERSRREAVSEGSRHRLPAPPAR
jgi:hypothetical protein